MSEIISDDNVNRSQKVEMKTVILSLAIHFSAVPHTEDFYAFARIIDFIDNPLCEFASHSENRLVCGILAALESRRVIEYEGQYGQREWWAEI
jgi:hypothetical protein